MSTAGAGASRVAVIVPCYNDGRTLPETVHSIRGSEPVELAVVDDGSIDPEQYKEARQKLLSRLDKPHN